MDSWEVFVEKFKSPKYSVNIAIVGKYVDLTESYKSLNEALYHGGVANDCRSNLIFVDSETIDEDTCSGILSEADGVLVPGGFGSRGIEGKICAARYARENNIPYFGICLGLHIAVIEFARNVLKLEGANSQEFDKLTAHPVIYLMLEWFDEQLGTIQTRDEHSDKGGTMRLGAYSCNLNPDTLASAAYGVNEISERHRHRYEFNNQYKDQFIENGMVMSGVSPSGELVEIIELKGHPWLLGCQFHPEFKSRPMEPHPLFREFVKASLDHKNRKS